MAQTGRAVLSYDSIGLIVVVSRDRAIALLVIKSHGAQGVEFSTEFLDHGLELQVFLFQPGSLFLNGLDLHSLPGAALRRCDLVLFPVTLFLFRRKGISNFSAIALLAEIGRAHV